MPTATALLPTLFMPFLMSALVKLSALILRRARLRWSHALIFSLLSILVGGLLSSPNIATGMLLPTVIQMLLGLASYLTLGGWYLGSRAVNAAGTPLRFNGGALLSLVAFLLAVVLWLLLIAIIPDSHPGK